MGKIKLVGGIIGAAENLNPDYDQRNSEAWQALKDYLINNIDPCQGGLWEIVKIPNREILAMRKRRLKSYRRTHE